MQDVEYVLRFFYNQTVLGIFPEQQHAVSNE